MNRRRLAIIMASAVLFAGVGIVVVRELTEAIVVSKSRRELANLRVANAAVVQFKTKTGKFPLGNSAGDLIARVPAAKAAVEWECSYVSDGIKALLRCPAYNGESFVFANGQLSTYPAYLQGRLHPDAPN